MTNFVSAFLGSAALATLLVSQQARAEPGPGPFLVNQGTEHQIYNGPLLYGEEVCFAFRSAGTKSPAQVRLRRTENGAGKDLDFNTGARCLKMHRLVGGWYVVYATAVHEDVVVTITSGPAIHMLRQTIPTNRAARDAARRMENAPH
jgi:hypothetical protein